ncbi:phospholipase A2 family protein [Brevibacillus sp. SYSU BS000544]|uniref:phospholipase A2 family protein n=1 Tax=Brevibacillus sp. SYSU BS000544 TaxID=3416443 RepID=UPI003CE4D6C9
MRKKKPVQTRRTEEGFCLYGRWCGLNCSGPGKPIDSVDRCCMKHDKCYDKYGKFNLSCDKKFMKCLKSKINLFTKQGRMAAAMYSFYKAKTLTK